MHFTRAKSSAAHWLCALVLALLMSVVMPAGPAAAARKAFVVGNSAYTSLQPLPNPTNDAGDLAAMLQRLGYEVSLQRDATRSALLDRFQAFARGLRPDDVALFFFAGHGMQIGGENYLFPVDASVDSEADARNRLVSLNALLADLTRTVRTRIVILDACRNNPFAEKLAQASPATRSAGLTRGLARVYAGVGSFIAYSTQPGNVALDGTGRNSPFTGALLRHMSDPGADVHKVMRLVRGDVQRATAEQQIPWENSSLVDEMSFASATGLPAPQPGPGPLPSAQPQPSPLPPPQPRGEALSYVTGLDPSGDNFLALRTTPDVDGERIATMGPDTPLKVLESRGPWRRVVLRDGTGGWAHSKWIACCRTVAAPGARAPSPAPTPPSVAPGVAPGVTGAGESCDSLWTRRNAVWHRHGYCFTSERGKRAFGNQGCSRDQAAAQAAMSPADRALVETLSAREKELGCR